MFHSIRHLDHRTNPDKRSCRYFYAIEDDDIGYIETLINIPYVLIAGEFQTIRRVVAVVQEYKRRNLSVPTNVAKLYLKYPLSIKDHPVSTLLAHRNIIEDKFPNLEYSRYYNCVLNKIKQLQFGKKKFYL